jgi:ubiquinone/menaquinone biosynthesis C-methylase UbiE
MLILDVGCGNRKMGDINIDIRKEVKPDIVCDIHYLPFRNKIFDLVYCYHVLEHKGINPEKAIKELLRVCNSFVEIQISHWLSSNAKKDKTHKNFQVMHRKYWLKFNPIEMKIDYVRLFSFMPLILRPNSITIKIKKEE